jgi:hypothetical protein
MRKIMVLAVVGFLVLGLAGFALAGTQKVKAKPFIFDPTDTELVAAAWVTHQGLPDAGKSAHALMLQISPTEPATPAPTPYKAGVAIKGVKGLAITELGFDFKNDGGFTIGPRFEVVTDGGTFTYFFADATPAPIDGVTDWLRVRFDTTADIGPGATAVVQSVMIYFDEEGSALLDNIDVNGALIGKPGNAKLKVAPKGKKEKNET